MSKKTGHIHAKCATTAIFGGFWSIFLQNMDKLKGPGKKHLNNFASRTSFYKEHSSSEGAGGMAGMATAIPMFGDYT